MQIGNQFRCYPTPAQEQTLLQWIGCQRFIYNAKVRENQYFRRFARKSLQHAGQHAPIDQQYSQFKTELTPWLSEVPSVVLRNGAVLWKQAYSRYFSKLGGCPAIHKKIGKQSVWLTSEVFKFAPVVDTNTGEITGHQLHIGTRKFPVGILALKAHKEFKLPASLHISIHAGRWHVSFNYDDGTDLFSSLSSTYSSISSAWSTGTISLGSAGGFQFSFNYYSLALQVAIMVYEDLTSCNQQEQMLGLKRGQNLCTYVGTYCSQELNLLLVSICMENTQSYCCYNSLLAKIIEEQGRAQIGKGYGSAQSPDCSGLTTAQFQQIDFSKIDLSQFTAQIMASVTGPNNTGNTQNASGVIQQKIQNYYNMGHQ